MDAILNTTDVVGVIFVAVVVVFGMWTMFAEAIDIDSREERQERREKRRRERRARRAERRKKWREWIAEFYSPDTDEVAENTVGDTADREAAERKPAPDFSYEDYVRSLNDEMSRLDCAPVRTEVNKLARKCRELEHANVKLNNKARIYMQDYMTALSHFNEGIDNLTSDFRDHEFSEAVTKMTTLTKQIKGMLDRQAIDYFKHDTGAMQEMNVLSQVIAQEENESNLTLKV